jgi:hypothetical protein
MSCGIILTHLKVPELGSEAMIGYLKIWPAVGVLLDATGTENLL